MEKKKKIIDNKVLIIDDEVNMLDMLSAALRKEGYEIITTSNPDEGVHFAQEIEFNFILCELKMPKMSGLGFLKKICQAKITAPVIMMSAFATVDTAVQAMKKGAYDFITKPFKIDEILLILQKESDRDWLKKDHLRLQQRVIQLEGERSFSAVIGESQGIKNIIQLARKAAKHNTKILITGESGTGKELLAKGIQLSSDRAEKPFLSVNCGAIPGQLLESEFFGYSKGAFTGADREKKGIFEEADGGTLFLDEIGELPFDLQVKLLRVMQEQEVRPIGSNSSKKINVRIIAATAKNLEQVVAAGEFRKDLFYRLNIIVLPLPSLRHRKEDITELAQHFIHKHGVKAGLKPPRIAQDTLRHLYQYDWPGNIRELENTMERAVIFAKNDVVRPSDLPSNIIVSDNSQSERELFVSTSLKKGKEIMEMLLIRKAFTQAKGNKSITAKLLEISYPSLLSKLKNYNLDKK